MKSFAGTGEPQTQEAMSRNSQEFRLLKFDAEFLRVQQRSDRRLGLHLVPTALARAAASRTPAMIGFLYFSTWFRHDELLQCVNLI
jgi:hypothetical protein